MLWSLAIQVWESPVKSMKSPITAKTCVVLGELCAERECLSVPDRAVGLEVGDDGLAVDSAVRIYVVDVGVVDLILVRPDLVDELLDAVEVHEGHSDLHRMGRHSRSVRSGGVM